MVRGQCSRTRSPSSRRTARASSMCRSSPTCRSTTNATTSCRIAEWVQRKATRGYHAVDWPREFGGLGLSRAHAACVRAGRARVRIARPPRTDQRDRRPHRPHDSALGSHELQQRFIAPLRSAEILCCQLFSEPGAGSDLAGLSCRAVRDGDEWVINGQKVWSSGAQFSQWGELIARTDPSVVKHKGLTAFMLPLDAPGVEVRPIKQMSGGSSFCEVFFTDVRIPDDLRIGAVGDGWTVATTTLSFERDHSESGAEGSATGGSWKQVLATARQMGRHRRPGDARQADEGLHPQPHRVADQPASCRPRAFGHARARRVRWASCCGPRE